MLLAPCIFLDKNLACKLNPASQRLTLICSQVSARTGPLSSQCNCWVLDLDLSHITLLFWGSVARHCLASGLFLEDEPLDAECLRLRQGTEIPTQLEVH